MLSCRTKPSSGLTIWLTLATTSMLENGIKINLTLSCPEPLHENH
jgi:hypothetical protein